MNAIAQHLVTKIGSEAVTTWENLPADAMWRRNWQSPIVPDAIAIPSTQEQLAEIMALASENRWAVLPCGNGSKLHWGGIVSGANLLISTHRLNRLVEHAAGDLTATVEAGMTYSQLQTILAEKGQFLALDPTHPQTATIGGIVATGDAGSLRQRYGSVRDQVLGISFVRADGQIAKAGGRVVKNVAGYDMMKLFTSSYGTLGILTQITFRLYPLPAASQTVMLTGGPDAIATATANLLSSSLTPVAADILSPTLVEKLQSAKGMGLLVRFQSIPESVAEQRRAVIEIGNQLSLQHTSYSDDAEANLWQQLTELMRDDAKSGEITCKIGVRSAEAVTTLVKFHSLASTAEEFSLYLGTIHAGSGLGWLRFAGETSSVLALIDSIRRECQSEGGFLTVLSAPIEVKLQTDVWGYTGNALDLMQTIKKQFDPAYLLSPKRFINGI
ncbi:FAD-binding oxidoreductase [[Phormidium] sp. ETS-05]|uniref:FAD-binding oxidoreductase n=1 Tax=[Phormidium] sp. ETS-05 TaxID=222819 RepID=UPI0018EF2BBF|nr:FAD-binding oxidoreductase [[Phormidium] sp. ETS-05]